MKSALIVGGTGPSGPFLVNGLRDRGYEVAILHRGTHEIPEIAPDIEHIHADPHFRETLDSAIGGREFDVAIATYGRIRLVAEALAGKTGQFIGIGGVPAYRGYYAPSANFPAGLPIPVPETAPTVASEAEHRFSYLIASTEQAILSIHPRGTVYRYPYVYGPYQLVPREWCAIRRILDRRPFMILADGGLNLMTHGYAGNLAHGVLLAVDNPDAAAGQIYNCGDDRQFSLRQIVEIIADEMNHKLEIIDLPAESAYPARGISLEITAHHKLLDLHKIKFQLGYSCLKRRCAAPRDGISNISPSVAVTSRDVFKIRSTTLRKISLPRFIARRRNARAPSVARSCPRPIHIPTRRRPTSPATIAIARRVTS